MVQNVTVSLIDTLEDDRLQEPGLVLDRQEVDRPLWVGGLCSDSSSPAARARVRWGRLRISVLGITPNRSSAPRKGEGGCRSTLRERASRSMRSLPGRQGQVSCPLVPNALAELSPASGIGEMQLRLAPTGGGALLRQVPNCSQEPVTPQVLGGRVEEAPQIRLSIASLSTEVLT